jgi:hypothetical protein
MGLKIGIQWKDPLIRERLTVLWAQGVLAKVIGQEFGVSETCIRKEARRLNLPMRVPSYPDWTEEETQRVKSLWTEGVTSYNIALILKRSRCSVMGKLCRMGLQRRLVRVAKIIKTTRAKAVHKPKEWKPTYLIRTSTMPTPVEPVQGPQETNEGISILELTPDSCREIVGKAPDGARWCGKAIYGASYCREHFVKNYRSAA